MAAPIALFVFKRPEHTKRTLATLARNPEFLSSELHIFCDGARCDDERDAVEATREVARAWPHSHKTLYEATRNRGLSKSIIDGVTALCSKHGCVVVVEDDLVVAPVFLNFLNRALEQYKADERVMQVSGHMFSVECVHGDEHAFFLPFVTSWGWATWDRAWQEFDPSMKGYDRIASSAERRKRFDLGGAYPYFQMLNRQRAGKIDSWAVRWYLSVFDRDGLVLYPRQSLVSNEGFDGSGTHCGIDDIGSIPLSTLVDHPIERLPSRIGIDRNAFESVTALLRSQNSVLQRVSRHLRRRWA